MVVALALLSLLLGANAQLSIQGRIESKIFALTTSDGTTATATHALSPPGYLGNSSVDQSGDDVFTSALSLVAATGGGSATLRYRPADGAANPTNAFTASSFDAVSLGRLSLWNTPLPADGSVSFMWTTEFASLQLFDGASAISELFTHIPILSTPMTLTLSSAANAATLAIIPPEIETYFNPTVPLGHGYQLQLWPADSLWMVLEDMNATGAFTSTPGDPRVTCGIDVMVMITPVPEPSTYALGAAALLVGAIGWRRRARRG